MKFEALSILVGIKDLIINTKKVYLNYIYIYITVSQNNYLFSTNLWKYEFESLINTSGLSNSTISP